MSEPREVVGAVALYKSPDDLVAGLEAAREQGFTRIDTVSPYPIHGMDRIQGKGDSKLGYVALVAGVVGVTVAKGAQWWMSAVDYPLNIGGKPLFSWPAFIPVTFELMVLFASFATVIGMIAVFNRLPQYGGALLRSKFIRDLTCDKFGLVVDARDPMFDEQTISAALGGPNVLGVDLLHAAEVSRFFKEQVMSVRFLLLLVAIAFAASTATRVVWKYGGAVAPFNFMKNQQKLNPQRIYTAAPGVFRDEASRPTVVGMRPPVEGTVARGFMPYPYLVDSTEGADAMNAAAEAAGRNLVNPIPLTAEALERGRERYSIFCQPCHGIRAEGNSTLTAAFPKPPSLHSKKVREWSDGRIYHVITVGQNVMPSYAAQIGREDRWLVVQYLRALQRSRNAPESDLP